MLSIRIPDSYILMMFLKRKFATFHVLLPSFTQWLVVLNVADLLR